MSALKNHGWPGNVRELRNTTERAVASWPDPETPVGSVVLDPFESPWRPRPAVKPFATGLSSGPAPAMPTPESMVYPCDLDTMVMERERELLETALATHRFNQTETAKSIALSYPQLRARMKKHGML